MQYIIYIYLLIYFFGKLSQIPHLWVWDETMQHILRLRNVAWCSGLDIIIWDRMPGIDLRRLMAVRSLRMWLYLGTGCSGGIMLTELAVILINVRLGIVWPANRLLVSQIMYWIKPHISSLCHPRGASFSSSVDVSIYTAHLPVIPFKDTVGNGSLG
jgi:hypothetical protein